MALIKVKTADGERSVRVCDYCKAACIPSGRFCSGRCARNYDEFIAKNKPTAAKDADPKGGMKPFTHDRPQPTEDRK